MQKALTGLLMAILALLAGPPASAEIVYRFEGRFSEAEQEKLTSWIDEVAAGLENLVGPYPFDPVIRFTRTTASEPVPWGSTIRGRSQGVRFYVDTRFSLDDFREDWTAAHELSHLILPFVGRDNAWFSEGFASFMQYQVMHEMGVLSRDQAASRYRERLDKASRDFSHGHERFVETAPKLRAERKYPVMYWGGAIFFFRLDEALQDNGEPGLIAAVSEYMSCCRRNSHKLHFLMNTMDKLTVDRTFSKELEDFRAVRGFPDYEELILMPSAP